MRHAHWHRFQILTKRADRLAELDRQLKWAPNIWMGVSVESDKYRPRIDDLRRTRAAVRFLSLEPLLGPLHDLALQDIHWVIVGGESGPGARPMNPDWAWICASNAAVLESLSSSNSGAAGARRRRDAFCRAEPGIDAGPGFLTRSGDIAIF